MNYSIVYSSCTGNTRLLAETIRISLVEENCVYFGVPDEKALGADRIYVGFWTDRGSCDGDTAAFLSTLRNKEVVLFGTAGFGGDPEYFRQILDRTAAHLDRSVEVKGSFMCQGKMPQSVLERYEALRGTPKAPSNLDQLIENFHRAASHPNEEDLKTLYHTIRN